MVRGNSLSVVVLLSMILIPCSLFSHLSMEGVMEGVVSDSCSCEVFGLNIDKRGREGNEGQRTRLVELTINI